MKNDSRVLPAKFVASQNVSERLEACPNAARLLRRCMESVAAGRLLAAPASCRRGSVLF